MDLTQQEIEFHRERLEIEKERVLSRKNFSSDVKQELEVLEKDLTGYDPDFSAEILRQLTEALYRTDNNNALRLRYARSILKTVKSGDPMEIMWVSQMIAVHCATMNLSGLLSTSIELDHFVGYGNIFNKLARTYMDQIGTLQRWRSGPEPRLTVQTVSVSDGGQAIVGHVTQNAVGKDKAGGTESPHLVTDQSGMAMPVIQPDQQSAMTVPRIEQNEQPAPSATKRKRRS